ncbi:uncharacterized protein EDB91DRAFT_1258701 [Suillus paluster]|uniref:uncharacterized protein n=1 Tax=Suillus paluster TaxID=48578 RepID=UPI001B8783F1|nr:uncharacterized protein EDB91DRAFT_1258701 [Suillus paluster]KAG1718270.1 hypothetical protein EDB91DRAFT_1258701 [Suillus paluster]
MLSMFKFLQSMDFSKLNYALERIALQHKLPAQEVLDRWLERQQASVPDRWRFLDGIPCIIGGLIALLGTLEGRGGNFPWKTLPTVLARRGCILQNYPENILMPGEKRPTLAKSKGISDLSLDEWCVLADALQRDVLTIKSVTTLNACKNLMLSRDPVIVGEAPVRDFLITCGRCEFANGRIDRLGLACPDDASCSNSPPGPPHRQRLRVFIEVPVPPSYWRLHATRQCSPVLSTHHHGDLIPQITCASRHAIEAVEEGIIEDEEAIIEDEVEVDHGDLIPQIACASQHAIEAVEEGVFEDEEGIIEDKEEVDELLGSQESNMITPVVV